MTRLWNCSIKYGRIERILMLRLGNQVISIFINSGECFARSLNDINIFDIFISLYLLLGLPYFAIGIDIHFLGVYCIRIFNFFINKVTSLFALL